MEDVTPEHWLPIPGYEGFYEASDWGRIRSLPREIPGNNWRNRPGRILSPGPRGSGYRQVNLSVGNVAKAHSVHHLVAATFHGPCPVEQEVRHLNGVKTDNRSSNLAYGTSSENKQDSIRLGQWVKPYTRTALKTHCKWGHPFDEANTRVGANGRRICRKCDSEAHKRRYWASQAQATN